MKSWLKMFLPSDEYKERQMLFFLAEAAVLQIIVILCLLFVSEMIVPLHASFALIICIATLIFYVGLRYIFSGIEYTDVVTEVEYEQQLKVLRIKSVGFVGIFILVGLLFSVFNLFGFNEDMVEYCIVAAIGGLFLFATQFISLKRSYEKNKDI